MSEICEAAREAATRSVELEKSSMLGDIQAGISSEGSEFCVDCDEPIDEERRLAAPFARRCITCQEVLELR